MLEIKDRYYSLKRGCISNATEQSILVPTNCVGAMGKGVALAIKRKFPSVYKYYRQRHTEGKLHVNLLMSCPIEDKRRIILLPTKDDWWNDSIPEIIYANIDKLCGNIEALRIEELACTYLGSGCGNLSGTVKRKLDKYLEDKLEALDIPCVIYK